MKVDPLIMVDALQDAWDEAIKEYMEDEDFTECLDLAIKVMAKPNIPPAQVAILVVQLSAFAIKFRTLYSANMYVLKNQKDASGKKNMYKELYTGIDNLVSALKYVVR